MKITSKGQVTIPKALRDHYSLHPQTEVEFLTGEQGVVIRPARSTKQRFSEWLKQARGSATRQLTTDEVMNLTRGED